MSISKEKDKTLEDFFEELFMAIWAVIHFSIMPVKTNSGIGSFLKTLSALLFFMDFL